MRVPQVNERVKEAPAHALRAMFAGIGQLLLVTDRLRNRATGTEKDEAPAEGAAPAQAAPTDGAASAAKADAAAAPAATVATEAAAAPAPAPAAAEPAAAEPTVSAEPAAPQPVTPEPTGNVRLLSEAEERDQAVAASATLAAPAAPTAPAPSEEPATTAVEAPLPNYDELTIASLRARLRNLTVPQLRELIEYEKAHAAREDVISMFERRIAKLES